MKILPVFLLLTSVVCAQLPGFKLDGEKWTYTAGDRSFTGYLVKPTGRGPFPAVIINHGKGGRPDQFSLNWAREMAQWGLVGICPTLTHVAGTDIAGQDGASAENIQRVRDCLAILGTLGDVDLQRVAICGHSMGGFLTLGFCGTEPGQTRAAAICAGGAGPRDDVPMPSLALAARITTPTLLLHGTVDQAVPYGSSAAVQAALDQARVSNRRVTFVGMDHGLPTNAATKPVVLALIREWFAAHGVLDHAHNTAPSVMPPRDATVAAAATPAPMKFTVADRETRADALTVTTTSSNPKVLPPANIVLVGSGAERTLTATPAAGEAGPTTVFLTVSDGSRVATSSFVLSFADARGDVPPPVIQRGAQGGKKGPGRGPGAPGGPRPDVTRPPGSG
jgi:dienelactone hydrolase